MKKLAFLAVIVTMFLVSALDVNGQITAPPASPKATVIQEVGLTEVKIVYSRPGLKGRKMFGGHLPYGELWRTGANASTKITVSDDVQIEDNDLPKGTYALYTIPGEEEWTIIFHKNTSHWGTGGKNYNADEDAFRFKVPSTTLNDKVETFTIDINDIRNNSATVNLKWENTQVSFKIAVDTDSKVLADIKKKMKGVSGTTYYQAARYYHETGKNGQQALGWIQKAIELDGDKFWMYRLKALILADLKKYKQAIKAARKSTALAEEAGNQDYVRMNDASIVEWKEK